MRGKAWSGTGRITSVQTGLTGALGALRAGASGFLGKGVDPAGLLAAIRTVAAGEQLLSPASTSALIERVRSAPTAPALDAGPLRDLTDREREITRLVATGLSNTDIAAELFIGPATAKTHVSRAMMKDGARDRAQLVALAYQAGLGGSRSPSGAALCTRQLGTDASLGCQAAW